jgi:hypothetical protein
MPVRMRAVRQRVRGLRLDDLDIPSILAFLGGWEPPTTAYEASRSRWSSWESYFHDYQDVRAELLSNPEWTRGGVFAEAELAKRLTRKH